MRRRFLEVLKMSNVGERIVLGCSCVAVVEWHVPRTETLHVVRIEQRGCDAVRHERGMRVLTSIHGQLKRAA